MTKYLTLALVLVATGASAQQLSGAERAALRDNCKQDIQTLCAGITPGGGRLIDCIRVNKDKLSKPCADTITSVVVNHKS